MSKFVRNDYVYDRETDEYFYVASVYDNMAFDEEGKMHNMQDLECANDDDYDEDYDDYLEYLSSSSKLEQVTKDEEENAFVEAESNFVLNHILKQDITLTPVDVATVNTRLQYTHSVYELIAIGII